MSSPTPPLLAPTAFESERDAVERLVTSRERISAELSKVIVGQREVIDQIMLALIAGGHCLITGAPGLAKTLLVKSIAQIFHFLYQGFGGMAGPTYKSAVLVCSIEAAPLRLPAVATTWIRNRPASPATVNGAAA